MASRRPRIVIFDLGNVLVHIQPEAFLQTLGIDTPENRRYYQSKVVEIARQYERGEISTGQFLTYLDQLFNAREGDNRGLGGKKKFTEEEFRNAMLSVIGQPVAGMEDFVRRIAQVVPTGLLSNTNPLHFDFCMEHLSVLHFIPTHFLSYRLKSLKPNPGIYKQAAELLRLAPSDVFYIDDLPENVDAARGIGFISHLFVGPDELRERLSDVELV
jgi:HAD superfamily hydrolase (TIGR01509 family)